MSVLEIVFVGQCEVFVCLDFVLIFFSPLAAKLIGPRMRRQFFKNVYFFSVTYPLKPFSATRRYRRHRNKVRVKGLGSNSSYLA